MAEGQGRWARSRGFGRGRGIVIERTIRAEVDRQHGHAVGKPGRCSAMRQWLTLLAAAALAPICAHAAELPDFGSPADAALSKSREAQIGRGVMLQLRNAGVIVDDPFLEEYVSTIGSRLATHVNDGDFNFNFFVVQDDAINAFALPGGYIGVNAGLLLASESENELAGVLAHEISHVT